MCCEQLLAARPVIRDRVLLRTSELVTNGVLHARPSLVLGVTTGADAVMVTVADNSDGKIVWFTMPRVQGGQAG
jgi:hypothetical protein